jgi:hypothetical protein
MGMLGDTKKKVGTIVALNTVRKYNGLPIAELFYS